MYDITEIIKGNSNTIILDDPTFNYDYHKELVIVKGKVVIKVYDGIVSLDLPIELSKHTCIDKLYKVISSDRFAASTRNLQNQNVDIVYNDEGKISDIRLHRNEYWSAIENG